MVTVSYFLPLYASVNDSNTTRIPDQAYFSESRQTSITPTNHGLTVSDVWALVWMSLAIALTTVGNLAICCIICRTPALQNTHNKFVLSLASCDLLMGLLNGPQIIVAIVYDGWILGEAMCQANGLMTTLFGIASVMTLSLISLNR